MSRSLVGVVLALLGAGIIAFGIFVAGSALAGLYKGVLERPLDQPENNETVVRDSMYRGVMIGAAGAPPFLIGMVLLKRAKARDRLAISSTFHAR